MSMNEASWPSFIAAPFICPSVATIARAVSRCRASSRSRAPSSERATEAAFVPAYRVAWTPRAVPSFAERRTLPFGIFPSSGTAGW